MHYDLEDTEVANGKVCNEGQSYIYYNSKLVLHEKVQKLENNKKNSTKMVKM